MELKWIQQKFNTKGLEVKIVAMGEGLLFHFFAPILR